MAAAGEFVDGWLVAEVLGEGAYGEVRLLVHAGSGARVALKAVRGAAGAREAALHRALRHPNVLRCLGARATATGDAHYLFLEVACGRELFERIAPDLGMAGGAARRYWRQLAAGLRYLHGRGVAHRDIKPENLLLTARDALKIADFGLATLFRHGARERLLGAAVGTVPYAAPEVLTAAARPYRAAPADTWAAAVVLLAMLAGELPWERACPSDPRYVGWVQWLERDCCGETPAGPWGKLGPGPLQWLRQALRPADSRASLRLLAMDPWMCDGESETVGGWCSQPAAVGGGGDEVDGDLSPAAMEALLSLSQPAQAEELLETSPSPPTGGRLRLTRLVVRRGVDEAAALRALTTALGELRMSWHGGLAADAAGTVRMRVCARPTAQGLVLECRRAGGCGLMFTRRFLDLKRALRHIQEPDGS